MISGTTPSTLSRISTSSYFTTTTMTMTQPREQTTETDTMGEKYFLSLNVIFYHINYQYLEKNLAAWGGANMNNIVMN